VESIEAWHEFYVATVGAAAALVGLIIVSMSVTIQAILKSVSLPSRALATIVSLMLVLGVSAIALFPGIGDAGFGIVLIVGALGASVPQFVYVSRMRKEDYTWSFAEVAPKLALGFGELVPYLVGGVLLLAGLPSGLYWAAAGVVMVFLVSMINAWVLLVEIQR
jgi:modulator of FtsH protease